MRARGFSRQLGACSKMEHRALCFSIAVLKLWLVTVVPSAVVKNFKQLFIVGMAENAPGLYLEDF